MESHDYKQIRKWIFQISRHRSKHSTIHNTILNNAMDNGKNRIPTNSNTIPIKHPSIPTKKAKRLLNEKTPENYRTI